jgi:hypothetical protein
MWQKNARRYEPPGLVNRLEGDDQSGKNGKALYA